MSELSVVSGEIAFSNVTETDVYQGKDTGKYNVVITMPEMEASQLEDQGVKVKDYTTDEGVVIKQRKFATQYRIDVIDLEGNPVQGELPRGSKVRVAYKLGEKHPQWGVSTYPVKVRVVELAEDSGDGDGDGDEIPDEF